MKFKIIDKDENELSLQDEDLRYMTDKLSTLDYLINDEEENIYVIPNHDLKNGIIFQGEQFKNNYASHYSFNSDGIYLSDSNNKISCLFKHEFNKFYVDFLEYFQDICEKQPVFLKNKVDMKTIQLELEKDIQSSFINIRYFIGRKHPNKNIPLQPANFKIPLNLILENQKDIYRLVLLVQLYKNHTLDFSDYTQDEFLEHAEDIFTQRRLLEY